MKQLYLLLLLLTTSVLFAQNWEKDTIKLNEVLILNKKYTIKTYKFWSVCSLVDGFDSTVTEMVTLVDQLPEGYVESVSFKFNRPDENSHHTTRETEYQDSEMEMVFYEAKPNNTPGERIKHERKIFTVSKDFSGKMKIDVSDLNIKSSGRIFIGLKRLTSNIKLKRREFYVDCLCNKEKFISYRCYSNGKWQSSRTYALKMIVKVRVYK